MTEVPTGVDKADAEKRFEMIRAELPAQFERGVFSPGASNDIWLGDRSVLRVCWRGNTDRLMIEAELSNSLPDAIGYPNTIAWGKRESLVWQLQSRIEGVSLDKTWLAYDHETLRKMISQLAGIYRALHEWDIPSSCRSLLERKSDMQLDNVQTQLIPLPIASAYIALEEIRELRWFAPDLYTKTLQRLDDLSDLDPFQSTTEQWPLIHCDACPPNLMEREGRIISLLDFEWARLGPIDMELPIWLHMARLADIASKPFPPVFRWLKKDYPDLFAAPNSRERLWLYHLLFTIHCIESWHPDAPEHELSPDHHVHTLRKLTDQPLIPD